MHVATFPRFGTTILTTTRLDLATSKWPTLVFESREKLLAHFDTLAAEARAALASSSDEHLQKHWKFSFGDKLIADMPRSVIYRSMFFNHLIHHRAQLGVYLRLNDCPGPAALRPLRRRLHGLLNATPSIACSSHQHLDCRRHPIFSAVLQSL